MRMKRVKSLLLIVLAMVMAIAGAACNNGGGEVKTAENITITGKPAGNVVDFVENGTLQLGATVAPEGDWAVDWISGNQSAATVSASGLVTFNAPGNTVITARVKDTDISDSFALSVRGTASDIEISGKPESGVTYYYHDTIAVAYTVTPLVISSYEVAWTSSDTSIATVQAGDNRTAVVTIGFIPGEATITATIEGTEISDEFTVTGGGEKTMVFDFDTPETTFTYEPIYAAQGTLSLTDDAGEIPAGGSGSALKYTNVGRALDDWAGAKFTLPAALTNGAKYTLTLKINVLEFNKSSTMYLSNISADSFTRAVALGSSEITFDFTSNGSKEMRLWLASAAIQWAFTVDDIVITRHIPTGIDITTNVASAVELSQKTIQLAVSGAAGFGVSWSSDNTAAATVSATGLVTLKAVGTVTITARIDGTNFTDAITFEITNEDGYYPFEFAIGGYNSTTHYDLRSGDVVLSLTAEWLFGADYDEELLTWELSGGLADDSSFVVITSEGVITFKKAGMIPDAPAEQITVTLLYDGVPVDSLTFEIEYLSTQPLNFVVNDAASTTFDVKDGSKQVTLNYTYTGDNYDKTKVEWVVNETSADIVAVAKTDVSGIITCVLTFKQAVYYKITASMKYDGAEKAKFNFTVVDSGDELLLPVSNDNLVAATKSNASRAESPFGSDGGTKLVFNGSNAGFRFGLANNATFEVGKTYVVLMDIKLLSYESGSTWMYTNCGASMDRRIPLPGEGQSQTVSTVIGPINSGSPSNVSVFVAGASVMTLAVSNIRVVVSDLAARPANTGSLIKVNGVNNNINSVTANNGGAHLATGMMPDGSFIMHAAGSGSGAAGLAATLGTTVAIGTYNVTADITLLHMHHSSTELWFRLGTNDATGATHQARIPLAGIPLLKKTTITFQIVVTTAGTTFRFIDPNTTSSGNIGLIFSNVVITSAV